MVDAVSNQKILTDYRDCNGLLQLHSGNIHLYLNIREPYGYTGDDAAFGFYPDNIVVCAYKGNLSAAELVSMSICHNQSGALPNLDKVRRKGYLNRVHSGGWAGQDAGECTAEQAQHNPQG